MPTLYLMQTFNDMGYYKDNGANVEFTYFSVYSDAITAYGTANVDATTDINSVKGLKGKTIAANISHSNYILAESFMIACTCHWKQQACKAYS